MSSYIEEEDFIPEDDLPVLDPPPGFEDGCLPTANDHYYDDPYSEGEDEDPRHKLTVDVANKFAENMVQSILQSVIKPRVKLRQKKPIATSFSGNDDYAVPIDSLTLNGKRREAKATPPPHVRHSIAVPSSVSKEPVHMTLEEVRHYLQEMESSNSVRRRPWMYVPSKSVECDTTTKRRPCFVWTPVASKRSFDDDRSKRNQRKSLSVTAAGIKQALFSVFRISSSHHHHLPHSHADSSSSSSNQVCPTGWTFSLPDSHDESGGNSPHQRRALPPLPQEPVGFVRVPRSTPIIPDVPLSSDLDHEDLSEGHSDISSSSYMDFAASIEEVKDHGWYWGPLSGEAAEKILSSEPDGSFLVRDSSDDHYIFSLSFKLNGGVRHVRIEHDHGIHFIST